jgi:hypothetical protein
METIEYNFKEEFAAQMGFPWPEGEWMNEPDKVQFMTKAGLPGLVVRGPMGAWCGYVGVTKEHPYFEKSYSELDLSVHGGLTFDGKCSGNEHGICHLVNESEDDNVWWLGFDCAHSGDLSPLYMAVVNRSPELQRFNQFKENYRNLEYVKEQVEVLAAQLVEVK